MPVADPIFPFASKDDIWSRNNGASALAEALASLPAGTYAQPAPQPQRGLFGSALRAGTNELGALGGAAASALGKAVGLDGLAQWGAEVNQTRGAAAQAAGRPDLEIAPWNEGGASVLPWLAYQATKQIPQIAGTLAGAALMPAAAVPAGLARAAGALPAFMGGGAGLAAPAAQAAGRALIGGTAAGLPMGVGSLYQSALDRAEATGEPTTRGEAFASLAGGVPYAAMEAFAPLGAVRALKGGSGGILKSAGKAALASGATEMVTEGVQTTMEMGFRPDLPLATKAKNVVDAALTGGAVGGVFGGIGGGAGGAMRRMKGAKPNEVTNDDLKNTVDQDLGSEMKLLPAPQAKLPAPEGAPGRSTIIPSGDPLFAGPAGVAQNPGEYDNAVRVLNEGFGPQPGPTTQANPFTQYDDQTLGGIYEAVQRKGLQQELSPAEARTLRLLQGELERRAEGEAPRQAGTDPLLPGLFPQEELVIPQARQAEAQTDIPAGDSPDAARQQGVNQMRMRALELLDGVDGRKQFTARINAQDEADLVNQTMERAEARNAPKTALTLLTRLGVIDEQGNSRDLKSEIAQLQEPLAEMQAASLSNPALLPQTEALTNQIAGLQKQAEILDEAARRRGEAPTAPVQQEPAASVAPQEQQEEFGLNFFAPPTVRDYTPDVQDYAARLTASTPEEVANLDARTKSELVQRVAERITSGQELDDNTAILSQYFGLTNTMGRPLDPVKSLAAAQQQLTNLQARYDADPTQNKTLAPRIAATQDRIDALTTLTQPVTREEAGTLQTYPTEQLTAALNAVEKKGVKGRMTQADAVAMRALREELARREQGQPVAQPSPEAFLPGLAAPAQPVEVKVPKRLPKAAVAPAVNEQQPGLGFEFRPPATETNQQARAFVAQVTGIAPDSKAGQKFDAKRLGSPQNKADIVTALVAAQAKGALNASQQKLAEYFGLVSKSGNPQTPKQALVAARNAVKTLSRELETKPEKSAELTQRLSVAQDRIDTLEKVTARDDALNAPVFITGTDAATGPALSRQQFDDAYIKALTPLSLQARSNLRVVDTVADLPPRAQEAATASGLAPTDVRGVLYDGTAYIVRANARTAADVQEAILHEVFGHGGVRTFLGADAVPALETLFNAAGGIDGLRRIARKYGVEKSFNDYVPANGVVDPVIAMDELLAQVAGRATGKFQTALLEWMGRVKQGLLGMLRKAGFNALAQRMDTFDAYDVAVMLRGMREAANAADTLSRDAILTDPTFLKTVPGANASMQNLMTTATNVLRSVNQSPDLQGKVAQFFRYAASLPALAKYYKNDLPQVQQYAEAIEDYQALVNKQGQLPGNVFSQAEQLGREQPKLLATVNDLMTYTNYQINPKKAWAEHKHLQGQPNEQALKSLVDQANASYREVARNAQALKLYEDLINTNEASTYRALSVAMRNMVTGDKALLEALPQFKADPMVKYRETEALSQTPVNARNYWEDAAERQVKALDDYIKGERAALDNAGTKKDREVIKKRILLVDERVRVHREFVANMQRAPYFHMGRYGEKFVTFTVRSVDRPGAAKKDGTPGKTEKVIDLRAAALIQREMEKAGFDNLRFSAIEGDAPVVFSRFESATEQKNFYEVVQRLQKQGLLEPGTEIKAGTRTEEDLNPSKRDSEYVKALINDIRANRAGFKPEVVEQLVAQARELAVNLLPDMSLAKVSAYRKGRLGNETDMIRNFVFRASVQDRAIARMYTEPQINTAFSNMRDVINKAQVTDLPKANRLEGVFSEIRTRYSELQESAEPDFFDRLRAWNHTYFLGFSPSYALINMLQLSTMLLPKLGSQYGFAKSAAAIGKVSIMSARIMAAAAKAGYAQGGLNRASEAPVTDQVLRDAKVPPAMAEFLMKVINSGSIDMGSMARELATVVTGRKDNKGDKALRMGAAMGYYTETTNRLISALAAYELHGNDANTVNVAKKLIDDTMYNYGRSATGRIFSKKSGPLGGYTPLALSFMTYPARTMEEMYLAMHTVLTKDADPKERRQAGQFLIGHAFAVTALAGSLGLPFAAPMARVVEKLVDAFSDDEEPPYDLKLAWRNYLAETFGKDVGEVLARGLPRALGFDISSRVGEQDLLPFSRLLTDRRKMEDRLKDWGSQMLGSPFGMASNIAIGMEEMMKGNMLEAMKKMVPTGLKGPVEAYSMTENGYVDKRGNKLPMEAGALDILSQALGFTPSEKAEYNEDKLFQTIRKTDVSRRAGEIRLGMAKAFEKGDQTEARDWMQKAQVFDRANPAYAVLPGFAGTLQQRALARARSEATGTPLGTSIKDVGAAGRSAFSNY